MTEKEDPTHYQFTGKKRRIEAEHRIPEVIIQRILNQGCLPHVELDVRTNRVRVWSVEVSEATMRSYLQATKRGPIEVVRGTRIQNPGGDGPLIHNPVPGPPIRER